MLIYYGDGSTWNSWDESPDVGVQCILVDVGQGYRNIIMGEDVYTDPTGQSAKIKLGVEMPYDEFMALIDRALKS